MNYEKYKSTWLGLHASNQFLKLVILLLLVVDVVSLAGWFKKDSTVILVPPGMTEKAEITRRNASEGYKKSWATYAAMLLGNVTPENADFVATTFSTMVSGEIRNTLQETISAELETLKSESVTSAYTIQSVAYDPESDKVYVTGRSRLIGIGGDSGLSSQTYEFKVDVSQYAPVITEMRSYPGQPKLPDGHG